MKITTSAFSFAPETAASERRPTILAKAAPNQPPYFGLNGPRGALDSKGRTLYVVSTNGNTIVHLNLFKKP